MKWRRLNIRSVLIGTLLMFLTTHMYSQSSYYTQSITIVIPEIQLVNAVDATGNPGPVSLVLTANLAGDKVQSGTGISYVQVSSIVASGQTRRIQASYDQIPGGTTLDVTGVLPSSSNGSGSFGASANAVTLSTTPQDIITGIGSCYTGTGPGDGYELDWQFNPGTGAAYSLINATTGFATTVTLTITAGG